MGVKPGVGMHQIGMRNAPQAGMAGICLGHEHGGNDNVMTAALRLALACEPLSQHVHADLLALEVFYRFDSQYAGS